MKISVVYNPTHNCLMSHITGIMGPEDVDEFVNEILKMAILHDCKRLVNDFWEAVIKLSIADMYFISSKAIKEEFDRSWKRAIIVKKKNEDLEFYELTALNKGLTVKIFENMDKALEWL